MKVGVGSLVAVGPPVIVVWGWFKGGLTATPIGPTAATVAGLLGNSSPPAPTSYIATVPSLIAT